MRRTIIVAIGAGALILLAAVSRPVPGPLAFARLAILGGTLGISLPLAPIIAAGCLIAVIR